MIAITLAILIMLSRAMIHAFFQAAKNRKIHIFQYIDIEKRRPFYADHRLLRCRIIGYKLGPKWNFANRDPKASFSLRAFLLLI
jgi:hypothetical protein